MPYTYDYPRPAIAVDCLIFRFAHDELEILLVQRKKDPYKGEWAFPGGFMEIDETPESAVARELEEETGIKAKKVMQIGAFGAVNRDPRGRTVSIAYLTLLDNEQEAIAASDASAVKWFNLKALPELAFDHNNILHAAIGFVSAASTLNLVRSSLELPDAEVGKFVDVLSLLPIKKR